MRKLIYITILFLGFTVISNAQEKTAKIKFTSKEIDYGNIAKGSDGVRTFEFTNEGNAPLVISKVYSSCGCTIPKKPEEPVAPGETGIIEVKYDTKRIGPIKKTITVYSNDPENATIALRISGRVEDREPESIMMKKSSMD